MLRGIACVGLLACLFGCSSGGSDDSTPDTVVSVSTTAPLTFEEWSAAASAMCEEQTAFVEQVVSRHPGVDTLEEVGAVMAEIVPLAEEALADTRGIGLPTERTDEVRHVNELAQQQVATMKLLLQTARGGNLPGTQQLGQTMDAQSAELVDRYHDLGIECARVTQLDRSSP